MTSILTLSQLPIQGKRLFVRFDGNAPIKNGVIRDFYRLGACLPTIAYLVQNKASRIVLATHIGRPDPKNPNPELSTRHLTPWFAAQGYPVTFVPQGEIPGEVGIYLLENLRFDGREKGLDVSFAQELASLADVYVNDAFGTLHRNETSITLLAQQFSPKSRGIGLCVERELHELTLLKKAPKQPFFVVLGGSKLADKLPLITRLITAPAQQRPTRILIGGALGFAALHDANLAQLAHDHTVTLHLPIDSINDNGIAMDVGPKTIQLFTEAIKQAQTIFMNGTMGKYEIEKYSHGTQALCKALESCVAYTVIGGGDAAAAAHMYGIAESVDFISTGGGATLAFLTAQSPERELPGLAALHA